MFIFDQGNLNTAALNVPGGYVQLLNPVGQTAVTPSNAIAIAGTASWGPVNVVQGPFGDISGASAANGAFSVAAWQADQYDLMRAVMQALGEAQTTASLNIWTNRISDGTDAAATATLVDVTAVTPLTGIILPAKYTGTGGNTIKCIIAAAGLANTFNVTFVATIGGQAYSETFLNIAGGASVNSPFWANLNQAILNGNQSRGPSQLIGIPTSVSSTAKNPALGTFSLAGGTDGRGSVTSSSFFGSDVIGNRQGIYAFRALPIVPAYVYCAGLTDVTKAASCQAFCLTEIVRYVYPLVSGTSTSSALSTRSSNGISDKRFMYAKDWIYWTDPISGQTIFTDPVAIMIGRAASLSPQLSPLNKQVYTVVGSEHPQQYPSDEIGQLNSNGIWVIANPCLQSPFWGIASASTTALNPIQQPVEFARLQDYIGIQFATLMAQFVGDPQGPLDPDPTRQACKSNIDTQMQFFVDNGLIVGWASEVDARLNSAKSVQAGYMRGNLNYVAFTNIKFAILNLGVVASLSPAQAFAQANGG